MTTSKYRKYYITMADRGTEGQRDRGTAPFPEYPHGIDGVSGKAALILRQIKTKFLLSSGGLAAVPVFSSIGIFFYVFFNILTIQGTIEIYLGVPLATIPPLLVISLIYIDRYKMLSTIIFSREGIKQVFLKEEKIFIKWEEVIGFKVKPVSPVVNHLVFLGNTKKIELEMSWEKYKAIMALCPDPNLRMGLRNLKFLKQHRKRELSIIRAHQGQ